MGGKRHRRDEQFCNLLATCKICVPQCYFITFYNSTSKCIHDVVVTGVPYIKLYEKPEQCESVPSTPAPPDTTVIASAAAIGFAVAVAIVVVLILGLWVTRWVRRYRRFVPPQRVRRSQRLLGYGSLRGHVDVGEIPQTTDNAVAERSVPQNKPNLECVELHDLGIPQPPPMPILPIRASKYRPQLPSRMVTFQPSVCQEIPGSQNEPSGTRREPDSNDLNGDNQNSRNSFAHVARVLRVKNSAFQNTAAEDFTQV